jgi:glucose-6-phosphate 1-dehydrogenase
MNQEIYEAELEYRKYQMLINTKEILNQEEYEFCKAWDAEEAWKYLNNIGPDWKTGEPRYLNVNVYSEADKEEYDLRREMGI